jgi:Transposase
LAFPSIASTTSTPAVPQHPDALARQVAPQIAAALLTKPRAELTVGQAEVVDALKIGCPGYAQMRSLMLAFRSILRAPALPAAASTPLRSTAALHRWLDRAQASGIERIQDFVRQLRHDVRAVDAAVTTPWSNGQVEGQVNRLKTLKRQMYGRAGVDSFGLG